MNHPKLARMITEKSREAVEWTESLGVECKQRCTHLGGHSVPRSYAIVNKQEDKLKSLGVNVKTKTYVMSIIQDKDGGIVGIKIREGYKFPDENSGTEKYLKVSKGLVLASGGFSRDIYFRTLQDPKLSEDVGSTNQPGATGEVLREAFRIGSTPVQISWIQLGPWTSPDEKGMGIGYHFNASAAFVYGVMVDPATGKRFINELADRKMRADAIIRRGHPAICIADSEGSKRVRVKSLEQCLKRGIVKKLRTVEALAAEYKAPVNALKETLNNHNKYVKQGKDEEFGRPMQTDSKPMGTAPYYACRAWPKVHHTLGGWAIGLMWYRPAAKDVQAGRGVNSTTLSCQRFMIGRYSGTSDGSKSAVTASASYCNRKNKR